MRPPETDVTFVLHTLDCHATEDAGEDEPYLWVLGFKVDGETIGPPPAGSLVPSLVARVTEGQPFFKHVGDMEGGDSRAVHPLLGTRGLRLRPTIIDGLGWFPGLAGLVALLWDEDGFEPSVAEAGYARFRLVLGPALTAELDSMMAGGYDAELARDAAGNPGTVPDGVFLPAWRIGRLADTALREPVVKALARRVKDRVTGEVREAIEAVVNWEGALDPDDLLGAEAQAFLGTELGAPRSWTMRFTDDEADYTGRGTVAAVPVRRATIDATVTRADRTLAHVRGLWRRVCWGPERLYWCFGYALATTHRFVLRPLAGGDPSQVRWFVNGTPLPEGPSTVAAGFAPLADSVAGPAEEVALLFPGGTGTLDCRAAGPVLEVGHAGGLGVHLGEVRALWAYPGDPTLFPPGPADTAALLGRGYDRAAELTVVGAEAEMDDAYREDVAQCARTVAGIDRKRIPIDWGRGPIGPGDPPDWRAALEERRDWGRLVAAAPGLDMAARGPARRRLRAR